MTFTEALIPIVVSGVMPITIMALIARIYVKKSEHRMEVMIKAIENGAELDQNALMGLKSKVKSTRKELVSRLGSGIMFTVLGLMFILSAAFGLSSFPSWGYYPGFPLLAVGIGLLVSFFYGKKYLKSQIEEEDKR
ncbi:MAG: hypothetical protein IKY16_07680 [Bacteroidales bacterium]|jgi:hypothetical protein|nr:hypothetical protein [Bacteroidales bacterium]